MEEEWKDIIGFEGAYKISNFGRVYSTPRRGNKGVEFLKISYTHDGYAKVRLIYNGKDKTMRVHRLVAEAFIPNPQNKDTVNHIDGDKTNNNVYNLEWCDRHEQLDHAYKLGLKTARSGSKNSNAKLTNEQVKEIRKSYVRYSKEFGTVALAKKYDVTNVVIGLIVRGETYKNVK